jgi:RND family efflux transporter MFP subunit
MEEKEMHTSENKKAHGKYLVRVVLLLVVLLIAGGVSLARKHQEKSAVEDETRRLAVPTVAVLTPATEGGSDQLVLPGQLQAFVESPLYARTSGYLMKWYKDIGSRAKKGELLADIDTPEVDQELQQARAARQQIEAQLSLAKSSAERWLNLRRSDSVSQQEVDQQTSGYAQAQANLAAADANVKRLEQLESFKHIYAPFSGVVTRRNIDVGALINAGNSGQSKELFDLAQIDPLRVYVSLPQSYSRSIRVGQKAFIELAEFPGDKFAGTIARTADAIDPATRTLLTEVDVPNREGKLLPGSFGQVRFAMPVEVRRLTVPVNALLFRAEGPRVAVVGPDSKVQLRAVQIGRDFGATVEILGGLEPDSRIVLNPADSLEDGQEVKVKSDKDENQQSGDNKKAGEGKK